MPPLSRGVLETLLEPEFFPSQVHPVVSELAAPPVNNHNLVTIYAMVDKEDIQHGDRARLALTS